MNRILSIVICLCLMSAVACSSTQKVDLFRVNDNGEVVNIGLSQDNNVLYGHFLTENEYQRVQISMTKPSEETVVPVCYIELSQGDGIRIEPCADAIMVNEGVVLDAPLKLDVIGIYHIEDAPWGSYDLYQYVDGIWERRFSTPILDEHWQAGIDVIRRDPSDPKRVFLTTSQTDADGKISLQKKLLSMDTVLGLMLVEEAQEAEAVQNEEESLAGLPSNELVDAELAAPAPLVEGSSDPGDITHQVPSVQE